MNVCILCRSAVNNELRLGKLHINGNIVVHQNCLYLSSNLVQRGNGRNDIMNFTLCDIAAESKRTKYLICCYCQKAGANIGCCNVSCRKTFHTNCGIDSGSQNQFFGTYKSFCKIHVEAYSKRPKSGEKCVICFEPLMKRGQAFCYTKFLHGKCCNNGWYHKDCLQQYANSAGYFFKCPLCNDTATFRLVSLWGITVPNCDASWEDDDAYADQLVMPNRCTAEECLNARGREGITPEALLYCILCGSNPMHLECTKYTMQDYRCNDCSVMWPKPQMCESDSDDLDPIERFSMMQTASEQIKTSNQVNRRCGLNKPTSVTDSDSDSDFWDELCVMYTAAEKENVKRANRTTTATAQPTHVNIPHQHRTEPFRMRNSQTLSLAGGGGGGSSDGGSGSSGGSGNVRRRSLRACRSLAKNEDPCISRIRTRSRSRLTVSESQQHEIAEEWKEESVTRRVRQLSRESIKATSPLISRGRSRTRSNAADKHIHQIHSPLEISCVANRTRARSRK